MPIYYKNINNNYKNNLNIDRILPVFYQTSPEPFQDRNELSPDRPVNNQTC